MTAKLNRNIDECRWKRGVLLLGGLLLLAPGMGRAVQTTAIQGVVYRADGTVAQGTVLVSWPSFTAADGSAITAGSTTAKIAPDGSVSMTLASNAGANPQGTYYTVVYHLADGTMEREYWVVPQAATATISEMRARVVPAAVAQQSVTQQYVDASINTLQSTVQGSFLQLTGGTMAGALDLSSDPASPMQAATKGYVDAHSGTQLPQAQNVIAGKGDGSAVSVAEKGVTVSGANGLVAWDDDLNAGVYDPRDPRWAGGVFGPTPAAAAQAMSNQMACDLAMGKVQHATARWPQGTFYLDKLLIAPGSDWEGMPQADGGTMWHSMYNNHQLVQAPATMTVTCSDGQSHTDSLGFTHISHFTLVGCATGGCTNAPGDTGNYQVGGPGNVGLEMSSTGGMTEHVYASSFGGYGLHVDGQDTKTFHLRAYSNDDWYYYGGYKGVTEGPTSTEISATTTGSTGSIALSWPAVTGATGYVIYRGSTGGGESGFYLTSANSFTDTGATIASGAVTNVVTNTLAAPGTVTPTPSTTGGTLAAGTYYYKITATQADGWHGSVECCGLDGMADWIEAYGLFDLPTVYTYHHLADILAGGGDGHFDHFWPQLGQVGIAQPYGNGAGDTFSNVRIDFTRLEGFYTGDANISVNGGVIDGSCTGSNAQTINTGQEGARFAGTCDQFFSFEGEGVLLNNVTFLDNGGFGPTYKTADMLLEGGRAQARGNQGSFQFITSEGLLHGSGWYEPATQSVSVSSNAYGTADIGLSRYVTFTDPTPVSYYAFTNAVVGQDFYVAGGNSNVTLSYSPSWIQTCSGKSINLGNVTGYLHFTVTQPNGNQTYGASVVVEVCPTPQPTLASSETVAFAATPTFSTATRSSIITLTGNVTSFTLAAGSDGQEKSLIFCQDATGARTVAGPPNVHGLMTMGATASKCSAQHFTYAAALSAWVADSAGVTNQ